jgi:hypothetical protein
LPADEIHELEAFGTAPLIETPWEHPVTTVHGDARARKSLAPKEVQRPALDQLPENPGADMPKLRLK